MNNDANWAHFAPQRRLRRAPGPRMFNVAPRNLMAAFNAAADEEDVGADGPVPLQHPQWHNEVVQRD